MNKQQEPLPTQTFEVHRWELHLGIGHVEASSVAEAIARVLDGEGSSVDSIYVGESKHQGMEITEELRRRLNELGINIEGDVVVGIHSVRAVTADTSPG